MNPIGGLLAKASMKALEVEQAVSRIADLDVRSAGPLDAWKAFGMKEKAILSMLPLHGGHLRNTCRYLGLQFAWAQRKMKSNPDFRRAVTDVRLDPSMMLKAMASDLLGIVSQRLIEMLHMSKDRKTQLEAMKWTAKLAGADVEQPGFLQSNFIKAENINMFPSARETERRKLIEGNSHVVEPTEQEAAEAAL